MTQITLQTYLRDIEKLIDDNRLTEAVAHCKHILRQKPRYIEAYRLLSKALLEQHEYVSAADVFQRILSADPEDFIAHVGLSIIHKAEDLMTEAIWHMERAYEVQPYHSTIQYELRDLYAWRDGELKTRELQLTPAALARLHFNAELYQQAVGELRAVLKEQPDRVDAQSLLAEALWRNDQRVDAVEICLQLLEALPHCIKANAILSEIWLMTGRIDEAQEYLQKLQVIVLPTTSTLNEDTPVGHAFSMDGAISVPHQISVEKLDRVVEEEVVLTGVPDWVDELGLSGNAFSEDSFGNDETFSLSPEPSPADDDAPEWLRALTTPASADPGTRESADVLDWLREVATGDDQPSLTLAEDLPAPDANSLENEASLPDWLSEVLGDEPLIPPVEPGISRPTEKTAPSSSASDEEWLYDDQMAAPPGLPDWMSEANENKDEGLHAPKSPAAEELTDFPDWLQETTATAAATDDDTQLSGWLDSLAGDSVKATPARAENQDLPDWFGDLTTMNAAASSGSTPESDNELPDWLTEFSAGNKPATLPDVDTPQSSTSTQPESPSTSDKLPNWFNDLTISDEPVATSTPEAEADQWFSDGDTEPTADTEDADALPDWFSDLSLSDEGKSHPTSTPTDEVDQWFSDLSSERETESTSDTEDAAALPDWVSTFATPDEPAIASSPTPEVVADPWFHDLLVSSETDTEASSDQSDWLTAMPTDDETDEPSDEQGQLPAWLSGLTNLDEPVAAATAVPQDDELADWLTAMPTDEETDGTSDEQGQLPAWLSGLTSLDEPVAAAAAVPQDDELADWLTAMPTDEETDEPSDEQGQLPAWLSGLTSLDEPVAAAAAVPQDDELADWLTAMPQTRTQ
ncbi:MAG: tetratricopeptide repeat protein [Chloroflexi bacterium]|nr:tetratricopeptide repeat protein [Chloroflexota bacterium]